MHKILSISCLLLLSQTAQGAESKVSYGDFYKRLDVVNKQGLTQVSPAFFLLSPDGTGPCILNDAYLQTNAQKVAVKQTIDGELILPFDARLKQDKAELVMDFAADEPNCAMSIQTKLIKPISQVTEVSALLDIANELEMLMKGHAGFWGKLFLPDFNGISLQLSDDLDSDSVSIAGDDFNVVNHKVNLTKQWLEEQGDKPLELTFQVIDIKPWLAN
ncbi:DUF2987 domain-containing protein [Motilimonas cestriensis]|uniref:DUF2987 domain-containing protein n=1 Tax=Motilimonas cestriensis TaxID=2742685 RepID=UPI003DA5FF00